MPSCKLFVFVIQLAAQLRSQFDALPTNEVQSNLGLTTGCPHGLEASLHSINYTMNAELDQCTAAIASGAVNTAGSHNTEQSLRSTASAGSGLQSCRKFAA